MFWGYWSNPCVEYYLVKSQEGIFEKFLHCQVLMFDCHPSFYYKICFFWDWGRKATRDFPPTVSSNYYIGFTSCFSSGFALFIWPSEKVMLCQIYLIHLGCLCHSSRCADGQLWIYWEGKWSCRHPISATSYSTYASRCMMLPPFKSELSSLLKVCFLHHFQFQKFHVEYILSVISARNFFSYPQTYKTHVSICLLKISHEKYLRIKIGGFSCQIVALQVSQVFWMMAWLRAGEIDKNGRQFIMCSQHIVTAATPYFPEILLPSPLFCFSLLFVLFVCFQFFKLAQ